MESFVYAILFISYNFEDLGFIVIVSMYFWILKKIPHNFTKLSLIVFDSFGQKSGVVFEWARTQLRLLALLKIILIFTVGFIFPWFCGFYCHCCHVMYSCCLEYQA